MGKNYSWNQQFLDLFDRCCGKYKGGNADFTTYYSDHDQAFLKSIGYKPREFFDFVEDYCDGYDIPSSTAVLIAAVRRDFLHKIQKGEFSDHEITPDELPPKDEELNGIAWLPRIIAKARGKLRGELHPDIMYSCGGDRNFLTTHDVHAADFLRVVWAAGGDDDNIVNYLKGE